jgi:hypothetical protein
VFALLVSPEFNAPGADQQALLEQTLAEIYANYVAFLTRLRAELPHARLLLLNYYNPFEVLGPNDPLKQPYIEVTGVITAFDRELAKQFTPVSRKEKPRNSQYLARNPHSVPG